MWIHRSIRRLSRVTTALVLSAQLAACGAPPAAQQPLTGPSVPGAAPGTAQLATSLGALQPTSEPLPIGSDDPVWGAATAPVTIVEFSDLQCPFCSRVEPTIKSLQAKYGPNQLRVVFKHNPLPFHEHARPAAKVADAVLHQGGPSAFFAFLDLAFEEQLKLGDEALAAWVARVGLDPAVVLRRAELPSTNDKIERDIALASKVGANGTPAFRINGKALSGAQPIEAFVSIIDAELAAAAELTRKGTPAADVYRTRVAANFVAPKPEPEDEPEQDLVIWKIPVKGAPSIGPSDALVTIVEFFDYQCPFCRRAEATMNELMARYPKDVRVVLRQNPLPFHQRALPAANFALEARAQKGDAGFLEANRRLFEGKLEEPDLLELAKALKLDEKRLKNAITNNTHAAEIDADADLATDFKAAGTPHFFINGLRMSGAQPLENFVTVVESQLKVANALVAAGTPRAAVYDEILKHAQDPDAPERKEIPAPSANNPSRGPLNAPIVIHEFADFQCPFCQRVEKTLRELDKEFPNKLRFVWHDYPLPFHELARPAAIVAREARAEKGEAGFWKMHDLLFASDAALSEETLTRHASTLQLDPARLSAARSNGRYESVLEEDKSIAESAGIRGTPAFVINGYYLSGAQPLKAFKRLVRYALSHPAPAAKVVAAAKP
ncbi:MAG TPA: thioredoxin domain-containing protein [Polyangiaceae bacterium]|jgi:protein-disulfide isomerase|nr:thioredoxin domain-containing protein [Polyangiaceae bacterium]